MAIVFFLIYLAFTLVVLSRRINPLVWEIGSIIYLIPATFYFGSPGLSVYSFGSLL